jgi:hypothetical protein
MLRERGAIDLRLPKNVHCPTCSSDICSNCKNPWHSGLSCQGNTKTHRSHGIRHSFWLWSHQMFSHVLCSYLQGRGLCSDWLRAVHAFPMLVLPGIIEGWRSTSTLWQRSMQEKQTRPFQSNNFLVSKSTAHNLGSVWDPVVCAISSLSARSIVYCLLQASSRPLAEAWKTSVVAQFEFRGRQHESLPALGRKPTAITGKS